MRIMPIRYCTDMAASARFYQALGLKLAAASRPGTWLELPAASGVLALHATEDPEYVGSCELAFQTVESLEVVAGRLRAAGFEPDPIMDENFGRSLRVRDPDGVRVQINEHDHELYT